MIAKPTYEELEKRIQDLEKAAAGYVNTPEKSHTREAIERPSATTALVENEKKYQNLVNAIKDWVWSIDIHGVHTFTNRAIETLLGYKPKEVISRPLFPMIHPDSRPHAEAVFKQSIAQRKGWRNLELKWLHKDGSSRYFESTSHPDFDGEGNFVGFSGVDRDTTARKNAEKIMLVHKNLRKAAEDKLRESEEKFRLTYRFSPDAININRMRDGLYVDINDGFTKLTGFTREDVAGKTSFDIQIWHDPADRMKLVRDLRENGFCDNLEALFKRKDGTLTTALMSARVISLKNEPHIISITRDISERKQAEAERERLLLAIEQANEMVVITDASGVIQYVNPAFEEITGYTDSEAIGKKPNVLKSGRQNEAFYRNLWHTILSGNPWTGRVINKRKNGVLYTGECSISPVKDKNGGVINFVWISRDITNELKLERRVAQAQKMEAIGSLAGGIAHDFNNLLFPIVGMSELLLEDLPKGTIEYQNAEAILKAGNRGSVLVKQILAFSRQSEHKKIPVRVQQVLKEVLSLIRSVMPSDIEILPDIQIDAGLIMADPTQIHQIAMNLITNAYHAMDQDGGKMIARLKETLLNKDDVARSCLKPGKYVTLSISDTGCGIDPAIMSRIFDPYFTTKEEGKGTGLGLAVVYGIVRDHDGDILVDSEMGKGTTFTIHIPLMAQSAESESAVKADILQGGKERILLVDDDGSIVELEKQILERLGYQVTSHTRSLDALATFQAAPDDFDMLISDMTMPDMNGSQLAGKVLTIRSDIPVILCTGFSERMDQKKAHAMGIKGFMMKPVMMSKMARIIRKVLDEK